jgi:hypothetical protein
VVLSTRVGKIAEDGESGKGSPFARAFAEASLSPGLRIEDTYALIREKVRVETSGEQVPDVIRSDLPLGGVVLMGAARSKHGNARAAPSSGFDRRDADHLAICPLSIRGG